MDGGQATHQIRKVDVIRFICRKKFRFDIPKALVSDNITYLYEIKELLEQMKLQVYNSTPRYPQ